ncbi:MAG: membrane protein insertion efficiency factor YidD [Burkholderiales bacterium]
MRELFIRLIHIYQLWVSPFLGARCRYYPSCSHYTTQALHKHGTGKGAWLGLKRLCRCHPWAPGGHDPVP